MVLWCYWQWAAHLANRTWMAPAQTVLLVPTKPARGRHRASLVVRATLNIHCWRRRREPPVTTPVSSVRLRITINFTMFYHIAYTWIKNKLIYKTFHNVVYCIHWHFTLIIIRKKQWFNRLLQKLLSFQCWPIVGSAKCILYNTEPHIWTRYRLQNCFSAEVIMFLDIYLIRIDSGE